MDREIQTPSAEEAIKTLEQPKSNKINQKEEKITKVNFNFKKEVKKYLSKISKPEKNGKLTLKADERDD